MTEPTPPPVSTPSRSKALAVGAALVGLLAVASVAVAIAGDGPSGHDTRLFSFGLWGDMPYEHFGDVPKLPALVADMNDQPLAFSVFDGDIKDGGSRCSDDQYTAAIDLFNRFEAPVVYVPGDNEWTDCHRISSGGYNNLERLAHLRRVMFARTESFGRRTMELEHQAPPTEPYSEHTRWVVGDAVFVTLNVTGSNNNKVNSEAECTDRSARTPADCAAGNAEYQTRNAAAIDWLRQGFAQGKGRAARGIMIVIQGNPGFDLPETAANERTAAGFDGFTPLLDALVEETRAFPGQVVLVHGDTHFFRLDKPLVDQANLVPNLTRLETFGSPNIDWVKVTADPRSRNYFTFEPMVVAANHR